MNLTYWEIIHVCYKCVIKKRYCVTTIEKLKSLMTGNDHDLNDRKTPLNIYLFF